MPTDTYQLNTSAPLANPSTTSTTPKLRDYMNAKKAAKEKGLSNINPNANNAFNTTNPQQYIPPVRPNPLGSENPTQAVCSGGSSYYPPTTGTLPPTVGPNEPPPPYTQYYDATGAGYTNPMYLQYQQNIAPPAYKPQASPNSQFTNLNANMANMSLQQQQNLTANNTTHQMPQNYQQMSYNSMGNNPNPQNPLVYQSNNQNYLQNPQNFPNPQQNYQNSNPLNNNNSTITPYPNTASPYPTSASPNPNITNNSLYPNRSTVSSASQMYSSPVVTTASTNYTPQPYFYGTNSTTSNIQTPNYQQLTQQNNYQTPTNSSQQTTNVPTNQPLYVATNQTGLPSSTANVAPSMQAPFVVNNLQNSLQTPPTHVTPQSNQQQTPTPIQNPLQVVGNIQTPYSTVASQSVTTTGYTSTGFSTTTTTATSSSTYGSSTHSTMHPGYSYNPQTGSYNYNSGYQQTNPVNPQFYGQYTTGAAATNTQVGTTDSQSAGKINVATGFDVSKCFSLVLVSF